ncbi:MipA/OmpV family protein [Kiritimatiellota bacterium B12222]|nr:MipA/OmpV family protein [Kiritimatiellota bacterium B12222]
MNHLLFICAMIIGLCIPLSAQPPATPRPSPWSAGVFVATDSQPYAGASRKVRVLPYASYRGERLVWNGPLLQYKIQQSKKSSFAVHGLLQFAAYDENDAPILEGMGDRQNTLLAGIDWTYRPYPPLMLIASFDTDILGVYNGQQVTLGLQHAIGRPWNTFSGSVGAGLLIQDQNWTRYFVGVPTNKATPERPAYAPSESFHPYLSAQILLRFNQDWALFSLARVEFLDETWRDSPLIGDDYRLMIYSAVSYTF